MFEVSQILEFLRQFLYTTTDFQEYTLHQKNSESYLSKTSRARLFKTNDVVS